MAMTLAQYPATRYEPSPLVDLSANPNASG